MFRGQRSCCSEVLKDFMQKATSLGLAFTFSREETGWLTKKVEVEYRASGPLNLVQEFFLWTEEYKR